MELYLKVRQACAAGMSQRQAATEFNISPRDTVAKMMTFSVPPGYRRTAEVKRPKLDPFIPIIEDWLEADRTMPRKQRHTAKRVFDRLREECGFTGGYTIIKDYIRERKRRGQEVFVPLAHPPGHAQADFGEAMVRIGGVEQKAHFFVLDLPHSDACYVRAYPAAVAEAWVDGHVHAFAFFGAVPQSIVYDNDRCLVAKILPDDTRKRAALFPAVSYVGYTATPFANVFIDPFPFNQDKLDDLYPRDFITALPRPKGYFGTLEVFGRASDDPEDAERDMVRTLAEDEPGMLRPTNAKEKAGFAPRMTEGLQDAVLWFLASCAIRRLRGQGDSHMTMLIHSSQYVAQHRAMAALVETWLDDNGPDLIAGTGEVSARFDRVVEDERRRTINDGHSGFPEPLQDILLEDGGDSRFPIELVPFSTAFRGQPQESAPWYVHWRPGQFEADFGGSVRVYVNSQYEELAARFVDGDPLTLQAILGDVMSQIVAAATAVQDCDAILAHCEDGTVGAQVRIWLERAFPGQETAVVRSMLDTTPGRFRAALLGAAQLGEEP